MKTMFVEPRHWFSYPEVLPSDCPADLIEFLQKCAARNPQQRPKLNELKKMLETIALNNPSLAVQTTAGSGQLAP